LKHVGLHPLGGFLGWGNFGLDWCRPEGLGANRRPVRSDMYGSCRFWLQCRCIDSPSLGLHLV
jgi:hypothetical protein